MTTASPGWYDDGHGAIRWWDGANWTDHVAEQAGDRSAEQPTAVTVPLYPGAQSPAAPVPPFIPPDGHAAPYPSHRHDAFAEPAEPSTSRMWVVWVILGVVVVGVVVALALLTPILLAGFATGSSPSPAPSTPPSTAPSSAPSITESGEAQVEGAPSAADQEAAVDAVERHNQSWLTGDCDAYFATTTEEFRTTIMQVDDCETFAIESRLFAGQVDDYQTTIGEVETIGSAIAVSTTESYTSRYDAEGNQTDEPTNYQDRYEYILLRIERRLVDRRLLRRVSRSVAACPLSVP